jgi:general stress protein YciG
MQKKMQEKEMRPNTDAERGERDSGKRSVEEELSEVGSKGQAVCHC